MKEGVRCFQWFKDTNSKANHNWYLNFFRLNFVVFNGSKILIRKQITTYPVTAGEEVQLFSMVQRY